MGVIIVPVVPACTRYHTCKPVTEHDLIVAVLTAVGGLAALAVLAAGVMWAFGRDWRRRR
jgi:hypothetical protein